MIEKIRHNFLASTRSALAFRAGHMCSFAECRIPTAGPGDASSSQHINIGVAAHIAAASAEGPRFDGRMTETERKSIDNGIWLCQTHSRLVDVNEVAYSVERLHQIKNDHEGWIRGLMDGSRSPSASEDFVALGPNIVFTGELVSVEARTWRFRLDHFLIGELSTLIDFGEQFETADLYDRFVLVNALGDGRQLACAPSWNKSESGYTVSVEVQASCPRTDAYKLPMDLALSEDHDLVFTNGSIATISGLDALPQKIKTCLSTMRGEMSNNPSFGTRIKEYSSAFSGSPWLPRLIKLEAIRMACVPYRDTITAEASTPLQCVLRVHGVEQREATAGSEWVPFHFHLQVEGVGNWSHDITIFIPSDERLIKNAD